MNGDKKRINLNNNNDNNNNHNPAQAPVTPNPNDLDIYSLKNKFETRKLKQKSLDKARRDRLGNAVKRIRKSLNIEEGDIPRVIEEAAYFIEMDRLNKTKTPLLHNQNPSNVSSSNHNLPNTAHNNNLNNYYNPINSSDPSSLSLPLPQVQVPLLNSNHSLSLLHPASSSNPIINNLNNLTPHNSVGQGLTVPVPVAGSRPGAAGSLSVLSIPPSIPPSPNNHLDLNNNNYSNNNNNNNNYIQPNYYTYNDRIALNSSNETKIHKDSNIENYNNHYVPKQLCLQNDENSNTNYNNDMERKNKGKGLPDPLYPALVSGLLTGDAIMMRLNEDTVIVEINQAFEKVTGFSKFVLIGKRMLDGPLHRVSYLVPSLNYISRCNEKIRSQEFQAKSIENDNEGFKDLQALLEADPESPTLIAMNLSSLRDSFGSSTINNFPNHNDNNSDSMNTSSTHNNQTSKNINNNNNASDTHNNNFSYPVPFSCITPLPASMELEYAPGLCRKYRNKNDLIRRLNVATKLFGLYRYQKKSFPIINRVHTAYGVDCELISNMHVVISNNNQLNNYDYNTPATNEDISNNNNNTNNSANPPSSSNKSHNHDNNSNNYNNQADNPNNPSITRNTNTIEFDNIIHSSHSSAPPHGSNNSHKDSDFFTPSRVNEAPLSALTGEYIPFENNFFDNQVAHPNFLNSSHSHSQSPSSHDHHHQGGPIQISDQDTNYSNNYDPISTANNNTQHMDKNSNNIDNNNGAMNNGASLNNNNTNPNNTNNNNLNTLNNDNVSSVIAWTTPWGYRYLNNHYGRDLVPTGPTYGGHHGMNVSSCIHNGCVDPRVKRTLDKVWTNCFKSSFTQKVQNITVYQEIWDDHSE